MPYLTNNKQASKHTTANQPTEHSQNKGGSLMPPNAQKALQLKADVANYSRSGIAQMQAFQTQLMNSPEGQRVQQLKSIISNSPQVQKTAQLQAMANSYATKQKPIQRMETEAEDTLQGKFKPPVFQPTNNTIQGYFTHYGKRIKIIEIRKIVQWLKNAGYDDSDIQEFQDQASLRSDQGSISDALRFTGLSYSAICSTMGVSTAKRMDRSRSRSISKSKRKKKEVKKFYDYNSSDELSESEGEEITIKRKDGKKIKAKKHSLKTAHNKSKNRIRRMRGGTSTQKDRIPLITKVGDTALEFAPSHWRKDIGVYPAKFEEDTYMRDGQAETYDTLSKQVDKSRKKAKLDTPSMLENMKFLMHNPKTTKDKLPHKMEEEEGFSKLSELTGIQVLDFARSQNTNKIAKQEIFNQTGSINSIYGGTTPTYGGAKSKKKHGQGGVNYLKTTTY
ncbi:MAG: hypothetical protein ACPGXL_06800 [Chitinophagales bacterium]